MLRLTLAFLATAALCAAQPGDVHPSTEQNLAAKLQQDPNNIPLLLRLGAMRLEDASARHDDARTAAFDDAQSYFERVVTLDSRNTQALFTLGVIGWTRVFTDLRTARAQLAMEPETPGPLRDRNVRAVLNSKYARVINDSIAYLERVLAIEPENNDSMAYMNLVYRAKADLEDSAQASGEDIAAADRWVRKTLDTLNAKRAAGVPVNPSFSMVPPPPPPPPPPLGSHTSIRVGSNAQAANLINRVDPVYPDQARQARIQGTVRLNAVIGKDGTMQNLQVLSGHPLLVRPAIEAVKSWLYKPTLLNGAPVEVITTIDVDFVLPPQN